MATPMDPLFALLPLLEKINDKARPFQELLSEGGKVYARLERALGNTEKLCETICTVTEIPGIDERFLRLDREKVFRWLLCKMDFLLEKIRAGEIGRSAMGSTGIAKSLVVDSEQAMVQKPEEEESNRKYAAIEILKVNCFVFLLILFA